MRTPCLFSLRLARTAPSHPRTSAHTHTRAQNNENPSTFGHIYMISINNKTWQNQDTNENNNNNKNSQKKHTFPMIKNLTGSREGKMLT